MKIPYGFGWGVDGLTWWMEGITRNIGSRRYPLLVGSVRWLS